MSVEFDDFLALLDKENEEMFSEENQKWEEEKDPYRKYKIFKIFEEAYDKYGLNIREGQLKMAELIHNLLEKKDDKRIVAIEAGTGVGKSFGYLIPLLNYLKNHRNVKAVISTGTKNLQDRLYEQDVEFASKVVGEEFDVVLVKGRNNYLCPALLIEKIRKITATQVILSTPETFEGEANEENKVAEKIAESIANNKQFSFYEKLQNSWEEGAWNGEFESLPVSIIEELGIKEEEKNRWFNLVSAAADNAICTQCEYIETCPFYEKRSQATEAQVIIANHHVVTADYFLQSKTGLSLFATKDSDPPTILVVDEAHDFPDAFRSFAEITFSSLRWSRFAEDWIDLLKKMLPHIIADDAFVKAYKEIIEFCETRKVSIKEKIKYLVDVAKMNNITILTPENWLQDSTKKYLDKLYEDIQYFCNIVKRKADEAFGYCDSNFKSKILPRLNRMEQRNSDILCDFNRIFYLSNHYQQKNANGEYDFNNNKDVCYFENETFRAFPVIISPMLQTLWYKYFDGVVLTSATLFPAPKKTTGYEWFTEEFGVTKETAHLKVVKSPFKYDEQVEIITLVNKELDVNSFQRIEALTKAILRTLSETDGGVLVLFTSWREMLQVAQVIQLPDNRELLVQGRDGSRTQILERFKQLGNAVLFGVDSFWQGIDVPGDALSAVVITKLPFPVPDDPLISAKMWIAKKKGENGWMKVCKPVCALKLQQGVGRLIRSESDKGYIIICDPRILHKHKQFLKSLPTQNIQQRRLVM